MLILLIIFFLLLSAFFSGSEIAFVSANKLNVEIKRNKGSRRGSIIGKFFDNPEDFLGSMLVGNNIALVVFTILMTQLMSPFFYFIDSEIGVLIVNTLIITIVVLIFGEYLPKTLFKLYANEVLYVLSYPLKIFKILLKIPTWLMIKLTNFILKWFVKSPQENLNITLNRLDLQNYIEGTITSFNEEIDPEIFTNALNLNQLKVRDCMVPRMEIIDIDRKDSIDDALQQFKKTNVSRLLVTEHGDIDKIIGYIHHQKLLNNPKTLRSLISDIILVPEAMNARDMMFRFITEGVNIACVVDEFGGTAGVITLEDVLEEIFGEIEDEYDVEDYIEKQISDTEYLFSGRLELDDLNDKYENLSFPEGDYQTLSGYIVMTSGNIPDKEGEILELENYQFIIEKLSDTKIETVRVIVLDPKEESDSDS